MIDGLDNNERYIGTIVVKPAIDALAEFKLYTNAYAAELGRTAGRYQLGDQVRHEHVSTDRCTSSFRNEHLDAKNFFAGPGPTPAFKQNQYGGSLGGPIKKGTPSFLQIMKACGCARANLDQLGTHGCHAPRRLHWPEPSL